MPSPWGRFRGHTGRLTFARLMDMTLFLLAPQRVYRSHVTGSREAAVGTKGPGQNSNCDKGQARQRLHMPSGIAREQCQSSQQEGIMSALIKPLTQTPPAWLHWGWLVEDDSIGEGSPPLDKNPCMPSKAMHSQEGSHLSRHPLELSCECEGGPV